MKQVDRGALRAVLFDLDGTLLDTAPDFATVVNLLLAENQRPALPFDAVRAAVSHGARALIRLAFGLNEDDQHFEPLRQRLLALYQQHLDQQTRPFPGIEQLLARLQECGVRWGVVTNKPFYLAEPLLRSMALQPAADVLICPDHVQRTKPDPEPLLLACARLGCTVHETVYIGDHERDIAAGRSAGMRTIAASYGYLAPQECVAAWNADFEADSVAEIAAILSSHFLERAERCRP
jgi:N-acetyl-D-muramate 6-phosphate phosphatase